jgi:hypothetical protein
VAAGEELSGPAESILDVTAVNTVVTVTVRFFT